MKQLQYRLISKLYLICVSGVECKNLVDIKSIANIPNLRVFDWCCSQLKPTELEFVMQKDSIQKVAAQFGGKRLNEEFKLLLMKYNL